MGAKVLAHANEFVSNMIRQDGDLLGDDEELMLEALQSISLSLSVLACSFEHGGQRGLELGRPTEALMADVLKLFGLCLRHWADVSMDEGESARASKRLKARFSG